MQAFIDNFTDPANLVGHIAYVFLIISMMMRTMHWLRFFAIAAGTISAIYYATLGDSVSVFWESLFALVNVVQLTLLAIENRRGKFTEEEKLFFDLVLRSVERAHARKLISKGTWIDVEENEVVVEEGIWPRELKFIIQGHGKVEIDNKQIAWVGPGDFLGEMSYLSGKPASATVIAATRLRILQFDRKTLEKQLEKIPELRHALESGFNRNLVEKLIKANKDNQADEHEKSNP